MKYTKYLFPVIILISTAINSCVPSPYTLKANVAVNRNICHKEIVKIAVFPFDTSGYKGFDSGPSLGENIADQYTLELIKIGYNVIERARLKKILNEQGLQMSGAIDPDDAVKVGRILGVRALVFGNVVGKPNMWGLTMRMVSIKTGEIAWTANSNLRPIKPDVLGKALSEFLARRKKEENCR